MSAMSFVHLHVRSEYSMLEGCCVLTDPRQINKETGQPMGPPRSLPLLAAAQGCPAVALTDASVLFGALEFQKACTSAGIHPILGCELWLTPPASLTHEPTPPLVVALCADLEGYRTLCRHVSHVYRKEWRGGRPCLEIDHILADNAGLVFLTGGPEGPVDALLRHERIEPARTLLRELREALGPDRLFVELQRHEEPAQETCLRALFDLARSEGLPTVATNGVRCLNEDDHTTLELMACIREGVRLQDFRAKGGLGTARRHLRSPQEMAMLFSDLPEAVTASVRIAQDLRCTIPTGTYFFPKFPLPDGFRDDDAYLAHLAREGLRDRFDGTPAPEAVKRLEYELDQMRQMNVAGYMLIVADIMNAARNQGIRVGPGRGSAVGSLVSYATGITEVDPIRYNLLFERFLNPERVSMPDIDSDFTDRDRDKVLDYVRRKYGSRSVSQIITYGRLKSKAAFKDTARVLGLSHERVNQLTTKLWPRALQGREPSLQEALVQSPALREALEADSPYLEAFQMASRIENRVRHAGTHAAAVIISPREVEHFAPLYAPEGKPDQVMVQFSKDHAEEIGLLKMDFLGLRNLTVIEDTCKLVHSLEGIRIDPTRLADRDPRTYALLGRGLTVGVFQFESQGMQAYLRQLQPEQLEDLIAMNALYRPGPMDQIPVYIRRKQGHETVNVHHPDLEPILGTTYGVMVYQEQAMAIAQTLAGYSLGGADVLRRLMSKKDPEKLAKEEPKFLAGAEAKGYSRQLAKTMWDLLVPFAGYAFNKSHAAAYAVLAYQTAWLKANHPAAFLCANCNTELQNTDHLVTLIQECQRLGIERLPPCVQQGTAQFSVQQGRLRFGLEGIKNVGHQMAQAIETERRNGGPFRDIFDLCRRIGPQTLPRRALESLVIAGALDHLERGGNRAQLFLACQDALQWAASANHALDQVSLFDMGDQGIETTHPSLPEVDPWSFEEMLQKERGVLGTYFSGHPLDTFRDELEDLCVPLARATECADGTEILVGGLVREIRRRTRDNMEFAFVVLEDLETSAEVAFWTESWSQARGECDEGRRVLLRVKVRPARGDRGANTHETSESGAEIEPRKQLEGIRATSLDRARSLMARCVRLEVDAADLDDSRLQSIEEICSRHPGVAHLVLHVRSNGEIRRLEPRKLRIEPSPKLVEALRALFGRNAVRLEPHG